MRGVKGVLGVELCCSGLVLVVFPCIVGICGPYISSALLILSMVIGQFLI